MTTYNRCAHCGEGKIKGWEQLTDDEKDVVKRLPQSADYTADERRRTHQWCTRCWHEEIGKARQA